MSNELWQILASVIRNFLFGTSLVAQWLGLGVFIGVAQVRSLVRELNSCKTCCRVKKKRK